MRRLVRSAFARLTVPNSCWSCHTVRPLASAVSHAVRRSRCISWTTPDASLWVVLLLKSPTISKPPRHAQVSHLLSGPTFWLVWAVLGWHHAWQVAGGRRAGRSRQVCLASSYPVLHASTLRGTLGADLCPFRRLESLGHVRGHVGWQTAVLSNHAACWERPFRDAGGERNVCAGICALLFAIRTSPWFPVTPAVTSTVKRTVVPRRSTQLKVHASNLVPIAPLGQRLPLLVRCCQI